jgi:hypothetical protein
MRKSGDFFNTSLNVISIKDGEFLEYLRADKLPRTTSFHAVANHTAVNIWVIVNSVLQSMWKKAVGPVGVYRTLTHKTQEINENAVKYCIFRSKFKSDLFKLRNKL